MESAAFTAHTRLIASEPADGDTLLAAPERFRLVFSGPVDRSLSTLTLDVPGGDSVRLSLLSPGDTAEVLTAIAPALTAGRYALRWQTVSTDGHRISGTIAFRVSPPPAEADEVSESAEAEAGAEPPAAGPAVAAGPADRRDEESPGPPPVVVLVAGLALGLLLGFAGLLWFTGTGALAGEPVLRRTGLILGTGAAGALTAQLGLWMAGVIPDGAGLSGVPAALVNRTGSVGLLRVLLVLAATLVLRSGRGRPAAVLAMLATALGAASGHSASLAPRVAIPVNALHLGAVAIWLGGLVLLVRCPGSPQDPEAGEIGWTYRGVAARVSSAALLAVILVVGSGLVQTFLFVPGIGALFSERYGRLVILKVVGLGALVVFGAWHRFRLLPAVASGDEAPVGTLQRSVRAEAIVMQLVILVAAWLAQIAPPVQH